MVVEVSEQEATGGVAAAKPRDRWTDAYANQPVRRMVALYDYDPQELSPNVDADVSVVSPFLSFLLRLSLFRFMLL